MHARRAVLACVVTGLVAVTAVAPAAATSSGVTWPTAGNGLDNTRFQRAEKRISVDNVDQLVVDWVAETGGDVSATPAVDTERVYVPDWAGNLYAFDRNTGAVVWQSTISRYTGIPGDKARATPAVTDQLLILGNQGPFGGGGAVFAVDKFTGQLVWTTQVDDHLAAIITQSAVVFDGKVFIGVASLEEAIAGLVPGYECCSFRGSMAALDLATGAIIWKTYMAPQNADPDQVGYSGNAIWGSTPAIDAARKTVYVATGNNYSVPDGVLDCVALNEGNPSAIQACLDPADFFDAVVALDTNTGAIKWVTKALPFDAWTVGCIFGEDHPNCPSPAGPDYDFGQGPALFSIRTAAGRRDVLGVGQKSGQYWTMDRTTGQVVWVTTTGPGGTAGGLQWGSAVDDTRIFTANANSNFKPWTLLGGPTPGEEVLTGLWSGLDRSTGAILWQTAPPHGGSTSGPVTTANGVVFGCSLDPLGYMYALDGATGEVLWEHASGGSCLSGAAISKGQLFWGSGYSNFGFGTPNNTLYAFSLDG
jgi:polyvinyl alcohol dehydrogenase (cytochrome)